MKSNIFEKVKKLKTIINDVNRGIKPIEKTRNGMSHNKKYLNFDNSLLKDILFLLLFLLIW